MSNLYRPFEIEVPHPIEENDIIENCSGSDEECNDAPYDEDAFDKEEECLFDKYVCSNYLMHAEIIKLFNFFYQ